MKIMYIYLPNPSKINDFGGFLRSGSGHQNIKSNSIEWRREWLVLRLEDLRNLSSNTYLASDRSE